MIEVAKFEFNPFRENTYVLHDETGEAIVVDAGCDSVTEERELGDYIEEKNLKVTCLVNTHCHIDHMLGNDFIFRKFGLKTIMHKLDLPVLKSTPQYGALFGLTVSPSPDPEKFVDEGDEISFGNSILRILHVPGHSPGHIVLINDEQKIVIGGDVLFQGSIGRTDLPMGDHDTFIKNIHEKMLILGEDYEVYPGHGPRTNIGFEKKHNPFLQEKLG